MPRKPHPTPQARQRAVDWLRDDTSVSDEEKIAWLHTLTGADSRKAKPDRTDADLMTPDWLSKKFEAEAEHRSKQQIRQSALRYAALLILTGALVVGVAAAVMHYLQST